MCALNDVGKWTPVTMHSQRIRQRRRRVTLDTAQSEESRAEPRADQPCQSTPRRPAARPYTQGARRSRQFKTTDLIPKRLWSVAAAIALLLAAIAGLNLLHLNSPDWVEVIGEEGVAALSLESGRSLGVWYSNFLLLLTSCVSLQIFLLRQHRRDDYRGSYRIWMWLALIFLIASAASVTGVSTLFRNVVANTLGSQEGGASTLAWVVAIKLVGLSLLIIRGLVEVRHSKLAVVGLVAVFLTYGMAHLINEVPNVQAQSSDYIHAALGNCLLFGSTSLFVSVLAYARFVYLSANGLVAIRTRAVKRSADGQSRAEKKAQVKDERAAERELKRQAKRLKKLERAESREAAAAQKLEAKEAAAAEKREAKEAAANQKKEAKSERRKGKQKPEVADNESARQKTKSSPPIDVEKRLAKRKRKKTKIQQTTEPDSPSVAPAKPTTTTKVKPKNNVDDQLLAVGDDEVDNLSKAERRRLRKLKRRAERRAA